jgi:hypothetical protein
MVVACKLHQEGRGSAIDGVALTGSDAPDDTPAVCYTLLTFQFADERTIVGVPDMLIGDVIRDLMLAGYAVTYDREASAEEA